MTDKVSKIVEKMGIVQAKQAQNKVEQASNKDNSDKLGEELHRLKAELEAAKKPELRHGDYGFHRDNDHIGRVVLKCDSKMVTAGNGSVHNVDEASGEKYYPNPILGNIFDDLEAIAEPLTEFEHDDTKFELIDGSVCVTMPALGKRWFIKLTPEFIMQLRRLQHTLRSKK